MADHVRFTPASMEAFKRTARDVQRAYGFALQESQELLAKIYGYPNLHGMQEHLKLSPAGTNPRLDKRQFGSLEDDAHALNTLNAVAPNKLPMGRLSISDLEIFQPPEMRKLIMDRQADIDSILEGTFPHEPHGVPSDYITFETRVDAYSNYLGSGRSGTEGLFRLTSKGMMIDEAMNWVINLSDDEILNPDSVALMFDHLQTIMNMFPNHPHVKARYLEAASGDVIKDTQMVKQVSKEQIVFLMDFFAAAKICRKLYESLMPPRFTGAIMDKLVGIGISNEGYYNTLYLGALAAKVYGNNKEALSWARRIKLLNKAQPYLAERLIRSIT